MQHLDEGTIHAWLDGALDAEEAARVERHAAECATCAAAVAEARGLVAGASRILGALDNVPGGVLPQETGAVPLGSVRSSRSLWRVLHFTPARAAAAAVLIVAAGTVLVVRRMPNGPPPVDTVSSSEPVKAMAPMIASPAPAPMLSRPADTSRVAATPRAATPMATRAMAARKAAPARTKEAVPEMATTSAADSVSVKPGALADVGGAVAAAPRAAMARVMASPAVVTTTFAGCYTVDADSTAGLPRTVGLDTTRAGRALAERSSAFVAGGVAGVDRYVVKNLDAQSAKAASTSLLWQPAPSGGAGGVRLFMKDAAPIDLQVTSPTTLAGTRVIGGREIRITLHRQSDCPPK